MACGTPIALSSEQFHAPFMNSKYTPFSFHLSPDEPEIAAQQIDHALKLVNETWRTNVKVHFEMKNNIENVIVPQFKRIFELIKQTPHAEMGKIYDHLLTEG
jgi:hypothetical protein